MFIGDLLKRRARFLVIVTCRRSRKVWQDRLEKTGCMSAVTVVEADDLVSVMDDPEWDVVLLDFVCDQYKCSHDLLAKFTSLQAHCKHVRMTTAEGATAATDHDFDFRLKNRRLGG